MLIDKIHIGQDDDLCVNVAQLLGDIVRIGREWHQMALPSPIIARLEETEAVERLLRNMLDTPEHSDMVIVSGISVLLNLMETRRYVRMYVRTCLWSCHMTCLCPLHPPHYHPLQSPHLHPLQTPQPL